jgi:hypothetical protein
MCVNLRPAIDGGLLPAKSFIRIAIALSIVAIPVIAWLFFDQLYFLRNDNGGEILWNGHDAYLFMSEIHRGYRVRYSAYPWVMVTQYLHAPPSPNDQRVALTVIRVTESAVERYVVEVSGNIPDLLTPIGGSIYANCEAVRCKWNGNRFEPASAEEQRRLSDIRNLSPLDFSDRDGWSKREVGSRVGDYSFSIELGKRVSLLVKQGNVYKSVYDSASIDLLRPGQPPEHLWYVDGNPRLVNKGEYERVFSRQLGSQQR